MSDAPPTRPDADRGADGDDPTWHALAPERVADDLGVDIEEGLSSDEASRRLSEHGPNVLPRQRSDGPLTILLRQVADPLIVVLIAASVLAFATGSGTSGFVVLGVVLINALIGFLQEYRAGKAIEAIMGMVPVTATVLRDGHKATVEAAEVVPGDVLELAGGDRVPADARLAEARNLTVEEAALTGESVPAGKDVGVQDAEAVVGDRSSIAFGGTLVSTGTGTGIVVATAGDTQLGRISSLLDDATDVQTPLTRQLGQVGRTLTIAIVVLAAVLFGVGLWRGSPVGSAALAAISLAVGAVPEGLPAVVTISLAIGVRRMAARRALVRRLPAVETLGSTTVICTDKTGTLTRNEMTVQAVDSPVGAYTVGGVGYAPDGELRRDGEVVAVSADVVALARAGALCNDAALGRDPDGAGWQVTGDPTEGALLALAAKLGVDLEAALDERPRIDEVPFESERQFMATLHDVPGGGREILVKGAPEVVLQRCGTAAGGDLDADAVLARVEEMADGGMRILALARRTADPGSGRIDEREVEDGLELLGLAGMIDPPRPEVITSVAACRTAGIAVKMITGDHPSTARAIGAELGLGAGGRPEVVTGVEIGRMDDRALDEAVRRVDVFARVAPEHKLRLVSSLQGHGEVVAMTGDGVNDAPALKQADIGVAMGITGTDVAKEAADVVLVDDDFSSIESAVEEGRRISDTLVKALAFILPTNIGLALILTVAVAAFPIVGGEPLLPVLPTQILWINLVAAVCLALPLSFEVLEPDTMRRPPRDPAEPLLNGFVLFRTAFVAVLMAAGALALFLVDYRAGGAGGGEALVEARTMAVTTVVLFQVFYLLNCRSLRGSILALGVLSNRWVYVGIGAVLALQALLVYAPPLQALFGTAPLGAVQWLQAAAVGAIVLPVISLEKWIRRRRAR